MAEENQLAEQIGQIGEAVTGLQERIANMGTDLQAKVESGASVTQELKGSIDKGLSDIGEMQTRLQDLERRQSSEREAGDDRPKSLGELVVGSEAFKSSDLDGASRGSVRVRVERSDITSADTSVGAGRSAGTSLVPGARVPGIITPGLRQMTVRELLMQGQTSSGSVEYVRETGFSNSAATVAEGATKPKSEITFNLETAPVRTIAHIFKASRQILDDAIGLQSYIDGRARYGLMFKEEDQLLNGDGVGQNLSGLVPQATDFVASFVPEAEQAIDRLRLAVLQVMLAEYPASGIVLNPIDWARIETLKDSEGRYIIGNPQQGTQPTLWNLPVVSTQSMTNSKFLVGAFNMGAQIFDRLEMEVLLSSENVDDFERNMFTIRAEERLALANYRPDAFVTGDVNPAPAV